MLDFDYTLKKKIVLTIITKASYVISFKCGVQKSVFFVKSNQQKKQQKESLFYLKLKKLNILIKFS